MGMDLANAHGNVNNNFYLTYPRDGHSYCDSGGSCTSCCAEFDLTENNGNCFQATTWHTDRSGGDHDGKAQTGGLTSKVHVKAAWNADGTQASVDVGSNVHEDHAYLESIALGNTQMSELDVIRMLRQLELEWSGKDYDIMRKNCCHFADRLCTLMGVGPIPSWTTSLAGTGAAIAETGESLDLRRLSATAHLSSCALGLGCFPGMCKDTFVLAPHEIENKNAEAVKEYSEYRQQLI